MYPRFLPIASLAWALALGSCASEPTASSRSSEIVRLDGARWSVDLAELGLSARFDTDGAAVTATRSSVRCELAFRAIGREGDVGVVGVPSRVVPTLEPTRSRLEWERAFGIVEWWRTSPQGFEHGLSIHAPPAGDGRVEVEIGVRGLVPAPSRDAVRLLDDTGRAALAVRHLVVRDATGRRLPSELGARDDVIVYAFDDDGASYPVEIDPIVATEAAQLTASDGAANDWFGNSVAMSGDTVVVGSPQRDSAAGSNTGAAHVFVRSGTSFVREAVLEMPGAAVSDGFGTRVAIDGDRIVVGAASDDTARGVNAGSAHVFVRAGGVWTHEATLEATDGSASAGFGGSVAIDGTMALVGAGGDDTIHGTDAGSVYVFSRSGSAWAEQTKLVPASGWPLARFGASVALSSGTAVVGSPMKSRMGAVLGQIGAVYVFVQSSGAWVEQAELAASDWAESAQFGNAVAVLGDTLLVGAHRDDPGGSTDAGSAYVFVRLGTTWTEQAKLVASDAAALDRVGFSVALAPEMAFLGAPEDDVASALAVGSVYLFGRRGTAWEEEDRLDASDGMANDSFGIAVAASTDRMVATASLDDTPRGADTGSAYVFDLDWVGSGALGDPCSVATECASGFCADGVCCADACGGGALDDCRACSVAAGSSADGSCTTLSAAVAATVVCRHPTAPCDAPETCVVGTFACPADGVSPAGTICRPVAGACDVEETCGGASDACPTDAFIAAGTVCRSAAGECDAVESCTGASGSCPPDAFAMDVVCRAAADPCDIADVCDGTRTTCPYDSWQVAGTVCREASGPCDVPEQCDGVVFSVCPADAFLPDGTRCDDGLACSGAEECIEGSCVPFTVLPDCDDGDPCTLDLCSEPAGECLHTTMTACGDGGVPADGGPVDAGRFDAGTRPADAGREADAGRSDVPATSGCGCRTVGGAVHGPKSFIAIALLALSVVVRRRRSRP